MRVLVSCEFSGTVRDALAWETMQAEEEGEEITATRAVRVKVVADALAALRAQGRRDGIEEAAKVADKHRGGSTVTVDAIRRLDANREPTT